MLSLRFSAALLVAGAVVVSVHSAQAADCTAAKLKAAAKKLSADAQCYAKALSKGVAVDPDCLSKAQAKFRDAIAKADHHEPCEGTAPDLEAAVSQCLGGLVGEVVSTTTSLASTTTSSTSTTTTIPTTTACCAAPDNSLSEGICNYTGSCFSHAGFGGTCDGATGDCVTGTPSSGNCCQHAGHLCEGGPGVTQEFCASAGPSTTFVANARCNPDGDCVP